MPDQLFMNLLRHGMVSKALKGFLAAIDTEEKEALIPLRRKTVIKGDQSESNDKGA